MPRGSAIPAWLVIRPGLKVRLDIATWPGTDHIAAVTTTLEGYEHGPSQKPDALHLPVGVEATVDSIASVPDNEGLVFVKVHGHGWHGFTRSDQMVPIIPLGTRLVVVGGLAIGNAVHTAALFQNVNDSYADAQKIASGTPVEVGDLSFASGDPDQTTSTGRYRVRILDGDEQGQTGWMSSLGIPNVKPVDFDHCNCVVVRMYTPTQAKRFHW